MWYLYTTRTNCVLYILHTLYYIILYTDKQVLITMLERLGEVTAMTGDGVNGTYVYLLHRWGVYIHEMCMYGCVYVFC